MVTVFTSVYNRKNIIGKLYQSLCKQIDKNFEWIIVDDGSTDNVFELIQSWQMKTKEFSIRIKKVENGGKHRAINIGVTMALSDAFFIVDSDDFLPEDAILFINQHFKEVGELYAGIAGLRYFYSVKTPIGGGPFFKSYIDATNLERDKYGLCGDKAEVYKTSILKRYPFPEFEDESFLTEEVVWNRIAKDGFKIRWFNKNIYYCEYLKDGLTYQGKDIFIKNPKGWATVISDAKKNHFWSKKRILDEELCFYENLKNRFSKESIRKMLCMSQPELEKLIERYEIILNSLQKVFLPIKDKKLALYGLGNYGKRLMLYLNSMNILVEYVIDKNNTAIDFRHVYNLDSQLPEINSVCVTLKNPPEELYDIIQKVLPSTDIWFLKDVLPSQW